MKLNYYTDAGHGWIAVKRKLLDDLGLSNKITPFSYMKGQTVYLEEDQDAALFLNTLKDSGIVYKLVEKYRNRSPIRNYPNYSCV